MHARAKLRRCSDSTAHTATQGYSTHAEVVHGTRPRVRLFACPSFVVVINVSSVCVCVCVWAVVRVINLPPVSRPPAIPKPNKIKGNALRHARAWSLCRNVQMRAALESQITAPQSKEKQKLSELHLFSEQTLMSMLHYWFAQMILVMLWWVVFGAFQSYFRLFVVHSTFVLVFAVLA